MTNGLKWLDVLLVNYNIIIEVGLEARFEEEKEKITEDSLSASIESIHIDSKPLVVDNISYH